MNIIQDILNFEWSELCTQLGHFFPIGTSLSHIREVIESKQFSQLVANYFIAYFTDILKRFSEVSRKKKIKQFNAPRGVHFCSDGFIGVVKLFGQRVEIPPQPDAEIVASIRERLLRRAAVLEECNPEQRAVFINRVRRALTDLKRSPVPAESAPPATVGIITPDPGTPVKRTPARVNEPEIIKFRDMFYCRYFVVGESLSTPMRQTRSEAESDFLAVVDELERHADRFVVDNISAVEKSDLLSHFRTFNTTVASVKSDYQLHRSTPHRTPQQHQTPQSASQTAVSRDIFKIRDKFYTSMRLFDQQVSTPLRTTINEAMRDREKLNSEIRSIEKTTFRNVQERSKIVSEIKMRISSSYN